MRDSQDPILQEEEQRKLRNQLVWRLGFAVLLIVAVLGVITWMDQDEKAELNIKASAPLRIAPPVLIASEPIPTRMPEPEIASAIPTEETASAPQVASTVASAPVATPVPTHASAVATSTTLPRTATSKPTHTTSPSPTVAPTASKAPIAIATVAAPKIAAPNKPQVAAPIQPQSPIRPAITAPAKAATMTTKEYSIQAGAFLHAANAEKLLQQLQSAGIPAYLETRVQIGPFTSKAEADAAAAKLRQMGITPVFNNAH